MTSAKFTDKLQHLAIETNNKSLSQTCMEILAKSKKYPLSIEDVIQALSYHLLCIENAKLFEKYFSDILLALVSTRIPQKPVFSHDNYETCSDAEKCDHMEYSVVLAYLSDHPDVLQYALKYFEINSIPPYEVYIQHKESYSCVPKKRRLLEGRQNEINEYNIVSCCYNLLKKLPNEFSVKWDWTKFVSNFCSSDNAEIRWMVKECIVILTNMTEIQSKKLLENLNLTDLDELKCISSTSSKKRPQISDKAEEQIELKSSSVINIDGIMIPVYDQDNVREGILVPVKSTINNLRSVALAVASGKALSLMGPVGSGKTSLVEHLATITGRKGVAFKKVQLGDQTDSRMLLGSHQCTDVPGEFVWRPGVLTEAVQNGHWLLLEDIDCAALDVASTLSSLLERNSLCVPGYRDTLPVTPGFQLFVTQRTVFTNYGFQKKLSNSSALLQKHLTQINVEPLSRSELSEIIQALYPKLSTICPRMLEVFMMFSVGSHDSSLQSKENIEKEINVTVMRGSRLISTRDLMKWCSRAVVDFHVSSPESAMKVLQDALDIFTSSVSLPTDRLELAKKVGTCLGIVETKSQFYCQHYKPNISLKPNYLEAGRAKVKRKENTLESLDFDNKQVVFSFTRQSACLLEKIACCVSSNEPVLLVGETGTGKTSSVQYLARQTGHKLVVINMNQQSDSADLLGGYKPVDLKYVIRPIKAEYETLFRSFYNVEKNKKFLNHIETCYETESWTALLTLMKQSHKAALSRLVAEKKEDILKVWQAFGYKLLKLDQQVKSASRLTFAFIEGSLVKAMQEGHWVLLDEINLASAEILECLAGLLEDKDETIDLLEKGDKVPIKRHPDFTLFACMNPATDVGKKDLPVGLRNRFTEFFIDELTERNDLMLLIGDYLYHLNLDGATLEAIFKFYTNIKKEAKLNLADGAGNVPHYSLRTLCRALTAAAKAKCGTVSRSLYESFCLSFLTQLDSSSHPKVEAMIAKAVIGKKSIKSVLNQIIPEPQSKDQNYLLFEGHWIPQGKLEIAIPSDYILTPTVRKNLRDIARIISLGRLPVLLQGDTSVGKTSLITYIAKASGNYCVRINNHEHTDLQEYIGSYASDANGKLVFKEGVLVEAMRKGYWIILDELNLAPSDVLEALNRVLDDNRELFIPETQQVVKADPNFMLFATQNPPGLYGGRKMLSRAFRNRFVELHFDEIPRSELETILHKRCHIPPTYSKKMIAVMAELQVRRRGSAAVQGKDGFITLRDLFRWGQRYKYASKDLTQKKFYDWDQHIADEGYLILAGKVRQTNERKIIEEVLEKHMKRRVNPDNLFSLHEVTSPVSKSILEQLFNNNLKEFNHVVWTYNMRRLAVLVAKAFIFDEPVLLVGETGCGKTTMCQVLAALKNTKLLSVNCHMHTESSDFLGGLRPVRQYNNDGRLFEWVDGPLINAMQKGYMFLADEISLADDSVLERMNSLLEPERQLLLAERGLEDSSDLVVVTADKEFKFIGTMNPGGDFGKKELSPALRNRFTEIWCDSVSTREDLLRVLEKSVSKGISLGNQEDGTTGIGNSILDFTDWLKNSEVTNKFPFSIRDLLSWVQFINITVERGLLDTPEAYVHGACMTFLDCFGTALTGHVESHTLTDLRRTAINMLLSQISTVGNEYTESLRELLGDKNSNITADFDGMKFGMKPFYIEVGKNPVDATNNFTFTAPTTGSNTLRLLRGLQLNKAILLEGNPGVGKTSLVTALAKSSGHKVVRINLSDQTDITDLFGTDLPTEDGSFSFKEGAFLSALQNGDWILLDELNLAPQPVLEGLNACLDHRGEVFIPELGKTFKVKKETRLFACQNPLKQGGARRGLPVSFLNRFTQVYIDTLTKDDLMHIVKSQYPSLPKEILHRIVTFNCKVSHEVTEIQSWAHKGSPWELNLRDIQRWCEALLRDQTEGKKISPGKFVDMLYTNRMRTNEDKERMARNYDEIFGSEYPRSFSMPQFYVTDKVIVIGDIVLERNMEKVFKNRRSMYSNLLVLRSQLSILKSLAESVKMNWLSILVGPSATGKSSVVQILADLTGNELHVVPVTSAMDVSDLIGGFEQIDYNRHLENLFDKIETLTLQTVRNIWLKEPSKEWKSNKLLNLLHEFKSLQDVTFTNDVNMEMVDKFKSKINLLLKHTETLLQYNTDISQDINIDLESIINSLKHLQNKVENASSLNIGGKFEWIDSLLVKTMIEGSWLLLDNVNLTSAAVLDRLNGLLEPNGVLSIPERGEICEIKPHPNFRVFFTMDPKYGELSRAMRNRGVEIFLVRSEDWNASLSDTVTYFDLVALLSSTGLPEEYHEICIRCHELMSSFVQGMDRPTVAHLIQAAHLTCQQIVRGISSTTAIINSFSDVYVKPRCGGDFSSNTNMSLSEMKNEMLKTLQEEINKTNIRTLLNLKSSHTLTVKELSRNSTYEIVKQISYIAMQSFIDTETGKSLDYLFSLLTAFQKCPDASLHVFGTFLNNQLQQTSDSKKYLVLELNKKAQELLTKMKHKSGLYKRFFAEYFDINEKCVQQSNNTMLLLYHEMFKLFIDNMLPTSNFSALDYSRAVQKGDLTDDFSEYPILRFCCQYFKMIDEGIVNSVLEINELDDENTCKLLQMLNWRVRFLKMCTAPIFVIAKNKRTPILKEEVIPLLHMHSKWLQKNLMEEIFKLLPQGNKLVIKFRNTLKEIIPEIEESTEVTNIGKKLRKVMVQPKVCESENQYHLCVRRSNIYKKMSLDVSQPLEIQTHKLSLDTASIINSIVDSDSEAEKLTMIEETISKNLENRSETLSNLEIKLIPVVLYVLQSMFNLIQARMPDVLDKTFNREQHLCCMLSTLVHQAQATKGFSPALMCPLAMIERLQTCMRNLDDRDYPGLQRNYSFLMSFWDEHYKSLTNSPALYPLRFFAIDQPADPEEMVEDVPINCKRMSPFVPLMAYYVQKLTVTQNEGARHLLAYETVSLQNSSDYADQLLSLQNIIWKNIAALNVANALKTSSNAKFEINKFNQLILHLNSIFENESTDNVDKQVNMLADVTEKIKDKNLVEMLLKAGDMCQKLSPHKNDLKTRIQTAELSLLTSVIVIKIMAEISPVDHIEKYRLKIQYIEEDIEIFNTLLSAYYMHGVVSGTIPEHKKVEKISDVSMELLQEKSADLKMVHPYCKVIFELKEQTVAKIEKYASGNTFRPTEPTYNSFAKDCKHFTKSVLSTKTLTEISSNMIQICESLYRNVENNYRDAKTIQKAQDIAKETTSWLYSINAFYKKIQSNYAEAFPDLAKPLLTSMSQIVHSVTTLNDLIKELRSKIEQGSNLKNIAKDLMVYPNELNKDQHRQMVRFVTPEFLNVINRNVSKEDEDSFSADLLKLEVLRMNLQELQMQCSALESIDQGYGSMESTLSAIVKTWEEQQKHIEKKKLDDEALYVTKSKCEDVDEDVQAFEEMSEMFPSYSEQDFSEFKPPSLEQTVTKTKTVENTKRQLINHEDVSLIFKWHSNFVKNLTSAEWLAQPNKKQELDVLTPFLERYPIFCRIIDNAWDALDPEFDVLVSPSLLVIISKIKEKIEGQESSSKFDFYRSPCIAETRQCLPVLHRVKQSTNALLDQWPDFPTLKDIMVIANRVLSFPVTSPVSRFLTGLELLRDKIEEWNKNAHKNNNLIDVSLAVGQQIINWRKLEMGHWKECLHSVYQRKQAAAHKFWFYLYSVVEMYLNENKELNKDTSSADRLITVLGKFMETSSLAEYEVRLDLIYVYHCHLVHLGPSNQKNELLSILWNSYNYYAQFAPQVAACIKDKRAPIEKKLRDFVKICSWDRDLSYWSVKDTVEKAHKVLHKHTKEFEKVLDESVISCLVDNSAETAVEHVGLWDRPKRQNTNSPVGGAYLVDVHNHIVHASSVKKYIDQIDQECDGFPEGSLLLKVPSLLNKAKILCKDTMMNTGYPSLVQSLDDFVTMIIENSNHLRSLEVDSSQTKEKQKSQAKNIIQQKRKALSDLFRYLTKMGLSYRIGLVILSASENLYDFTIHPVDLEVAIKYLKSRRCDSSLSLLWSGCEKYFQKNIARHRQFTAAMQSPHEDLGMQNIERCKGFAAHLLKLTNSQKKCISKYSRKLCDLRALTTCLTNALEVDSTNNVTNLDDKMQVINECLANTSIVLEQFRVVLKSFPEQELRPASEPHFDCELSDSPLVMCYQNNDEWNDLYSRIRNITTTINKQKTAVSKLRQTMPKVIGDDKTVKVVSQAQVEGINEAKTALKNVRTDLNKTLKDYQYTPNKHPELSVECSHPVMRSLENLDKYINESLEQLDKLDEKGEDYTEETADRLSVVTQCEDLIATMLLIIQSVYKKHLTTKSKSDSMDVIDKIDEIIDESTKDEQKEIIEDNHLKELLQEKLFSDAKMLQMQTVINKLYSLSEDFMNYIGTGMRVEKVKNAVTRLIPILEQTVLFVQYFISQQVAAHRVSCKMLSVLLKIFTDLASKGFCKPSDLDADEADGEGGPGKLSGGTGLGDGEGQTDVSERIENQDQLDDAHRPGEEKKEEERDCKEEEKGVNMTDDFDSHLQDVEPKEGEDSDQDDDNDDADKQMGDIDNSAEKLDQKIWGSEDESEPEENNESKEEKGKGESTGEKEMGAKEQEQGNDDGNEGKDRKQKKDINKMDDQDVDDDHNDPYYGKEQQYPEPEDFEMPDNPDMDGDEKEDKDGETETENPFDIDVMKEDKKDEQEEDKQADKEENRNGLDVSSDEEDGDDSQDDKEQSEKQKQDGESDTEAKDDDPTNPDKEKEDPENSQENDLQDTEKPSEIEPNTEEPETPEQDKKDDELPKNPDKIEDDEETEQKNQESNPQANPSSDDASAEDKAENAEMDSGANDNVETNAEQTKDAEAAPFEQAQEQVGDEKQSTGRSELDKSDKGHRGEKQAVSRSDSNKQQKQKENKPGRTDQERTLGDVNEKKHKQTLTLNVEKEQSQEEGGEDDENADKDADAFQHVKEAKKDDLQAIDAATKEQADQQPTIQEEEDSEKLKQDEEVPMDIDENDLEVEKSEEINPEKIKDGREKETDKSGNKKEGAEETTGETGIEIEGENAVTENVPRGLDTTFHTRLEPMQHEFEEMSVEQYMNIREWLSSGASHNVPTTPVWRALWAESATAARALCERLRLVLEPTGRSRRAGDFRTGRAINMRRVIPYIASQFRKDRIWLRRTKPAKREYKIAIAVDNSSSMSDNKSKEMAFESLALVSQALNLLESGDLSVLSFGEEPKLLHPFTEQFSEHSGSKILEQLRFDQTKTKIAQLLDFCSVMFEEQAIRSDAVNAKLLVIVSDGRGIFSEGETRVLQAVRRARQQGIFLVYVIIDNPDNKDSIMDIRRPVMDSTSNLVRFVPYLDTFPFPFYVILRDMSALPNVLGDALRQWFELAANTS